LSRLTLDESLPDFFRHAIADIVERRGYPLSTPSQLYTAQLLVEFARTDTSSNPTDETALALLLAHALEAAGETRLAKLRQLGDVALYRSGFFQERLARTSVGPGYFAQMGQTAYGQVSSLMGARPHGQKFAALFDELAMRFPVIVSILNEMHDRSQANSDEALLKIYERWLATGQPSLRDILVERGFVLGSTDDASRAN
jgi:hypothetical protein